MSKNKYSFENILEWLRDPQKCIYKPFLNTLNEIPVYLEALAEGKKLILGFDAKNLMLIGCELQISELKKTFPGLQIHLIQRNEKNIIVLEKKIKPQKASDLQSVQDSFPFSEPAAIVPEKPLPKTRPNEALSPNTYTDLDFEPFQLN